MTKNDTNETHLVFAFNDLQWVQMQLAKLGYSDEAESFNAPIAIAANRPEIDRGHHQPVDGELVPKFLHLNPTLALDGNLEAKLCRLCTHVMIIMGLYGDIGAVDIVDALDAPSRAIGRLIRLD